MVFSINWYYLISTDINFNPILVSFSGLASAQEQGEISWPGRDLNQMKNNLLIF